jgi:hypothetical protein
VFPVGGGAPVTLGGGGDLLQHWSGRGKVRHKPSKEEKAVWRELTEGGGWRRRFVNGGYEVKGGGVEELSVSSSVKKGGARKMGWWQ